ncbi:hypothetical protein BBO99_00008163 [Phytophthora kernoviae]|uniref:Protein kinase domain-containing protein n=2 Tax=Phytophthora kernoviae TaxID=325452 RepID=A0A3R7KQN5_9STRA|nr:hypothetical protein G195_009491 [Phytophthora kernoviae 00238/432]KAG2516748.1 hypothetical protein JM18_007841 [Phytophthora kernoviae]KAG2526980.1 hypothetical protein JM16_002381 [Phytophthora kernoviae]RLN46867.1 hypothetical protein BBI17_008093 [Phytophthora kernoviae]RLN75664.1 hypothetical protein BBO99_00008163 [Phytophthora kernoviae]
MGAIISRGAFGEVHRGLYRGQDVAIKTLLPEKRKDLQYIQAFLSEVRLMATMEHPYIVQFIGVAWESLSDLYCVSEFMAGGDLRSLLKDYLATGVPQGMDATKMQITYHVAYALTYLHSLEPVVLHRDLKSRNILLTPSLDAKITDFGASRIRSDATMTAGVGSSLWMAPEVMMGNRYDEKADVFSLGVVMSELDTHELPYSHAKESNVDSSNSGSRPLPDAAVLQMVSTGKLRVYFSHYMNSDMARFARSCVEVDPRMRPTAAEMPASVPVGKQRLAYETFLEKRASSISEPQKSAIDQAALLDRAIRNYDAVAAQVRPLDKSEPSLDAPSALMEAIRMPGPQVPKVRKSKSIALPALPSVDLDEIEIPEMHEALCRAFCSPNSWSPAFASPGDFTIKMDSVYQENGEICFKIAVMCCCARSICDGSRVKPASKRQYYVSYVERTQHELVQLTEALALQYLGHRLADKIPTHGTSLLTTRRRRSLDEYGEKVIRFLSYVMQISVIGFNGLITLKDPVASNVRVRDFLGLALSIGEQTIVATSSCDARIEGQNVEISGVSVMDGIAKYAISVLSYTNGALEVVTIDRRYSEFDELVVTIEAKLPALQIRSLLPPKTFFRYVSASFLERRAAYLQMFLERVLRLNFSGVLDQEIPLTAEPNRMEKTEVDELRQLTQRVCENVTAYIGAQLNGSLESMQLLEIVVGNINTKYTSMRREAKSIGKLSEVLEARAIAMKEKMQIIDDIDEELTELEDMVDQLDQYTGSLGEKLDLHVFGLHYHRSSHGC